MLLPATTTSEVVSTAVATVALIVSGVTLYLQRRDRRADTETRLELAAAPLDRLGGFAPKYATGDGALVPSGHPLLAGDVAYELRIIVRNHSRDPIFVREVWAQETPKPEDEDAIAFPLYARDKQFEIKVKGALTFEAYLGGDVLRRLANRRSSLQVTVATQDNTTLAAEWMAVSDRVISDRLLQALNRYYDDGCDICGRPLLGEPSRGGVVRSGGLDAWWLRLPSPKLIPTQEPPTSEPPGGAHVECLMSLGDSEEEPSDD